MSDANPTPEGTEPPKGILQGFLNFIEWAGNKLPDPVMIFFGAFLLVVVLSAVLAPVKFNEDDPRTKGKKDDPATKNVDESIPAKIQVKDLTTGKSIATFLSVMVTTFTSFAPLGVVLVALLGVGVAERTGFIGAIIRALLSATPKMMLTPMLLLVSIVSHTAGDTGYVLVIPLGGVIFAAAGRHPLAGIVCAFAGVSGGFSANFIPSGLDPLLQGFTQSAAQIHTTGKEVNPLCNWFFMSASCGIIVAVGWYLTDCVIEPRLKNTPVDGDPEDHPTLTPLTTREWGGLVIALLVFAAGVVLLVLAALPSDSPLRDPNGKLETFGSPMMKSIVSLIFFLFLIPGIVYGYAAGTVKGHRDIIQAMSDSMKTMGHYIVLAFFAAQFIYVLNTSNIGALLSVKGASLLEKWNLAGPLTIILFIFLASGVNLVVGSASAKWGMLAPIFVPMLMGRGLSPELTQAAYRIGDSSTNILTPLNPYFPLVVIYAQRYVKKTGIGSLISLMLPYAICFLLTWTVLLVAYWQMGFKLGLGATYTI